MTPSAENVVPRSPVQDWLDQHEAQQTTVGDSRFVLRFASDEIERSAMETLGLCDVSGLRKLGLKGPDAHRALQAARLDVPHNIFESRPLTDGGVIVRFGSDEFFLESGFQDKSVRAVSDSVDQSQGQMFRVAHQEASFLVSGSRGPEVLAQTCGINFSEAVPQQAVFTRVAGVSCCILPDTVRQVLCYRIWVDPSYAMYLWDTLVEICESLDGRVIGAGCLFPTLTA
ncbi:MAG: hypothetical protein MK110_00185 [Fuerstiella sp.]|nr:hypothetical protein [Fuerstiella sp.]